MGRVGCGGDGVVRFSTTVRAGPERWAGDAVRGDDGVIVPELVVLGRATGAFRSAVDVLAAGAAEGRPAGAEAVRAAAGLGGEDAAAWRAGAGAAGSFDGRFGIGFAGTGTAATASGGATRRNRESSDRRDPSPILPWSTPLGPYPAAEAVRDLGAAVAVRARPAAGSVSAPPP
jgi:hypothetical protein